MRLPLLALGDDLDEAALVTAAQPPEWRVPVLTYYVAAAAHFGPDETRTIATDTLAALGDTTFAADLLAALLQHADAVAAREAAVRRLQPRTGSTYPNNVVPLRRPA